MKKFLLFCFFGMILCCSKAFVLELESDFADYNGNLMTLTGNVKIMHETGRLLADYVEAFKDKENQFAEIAEFKLYGSVKISLKNGTTIESKEAFFDQKTRAAKFYGNSELPVKIYFKEGIKISSLNDVEVRFDDRYSLKSLESNGETTLDYHISSPEEHAVLICYGTTYFDHAKQTLSLNSPLVQGKSTKKERIHLKNCFANIAGDTSIISYELMDDKFILKTVEINGQVEIQNQNIDKQLKSPIFTGYVQADALFYNAQNHAMTLSSKPGNLIYFHDILRNTQMKASSIHIHRDPTTKKELIQAKGKVRLIYGT